MKSNHIDDFFIRNDSGGQADCYILDEHKESMKNNGVGKVRFAPVARAYPMRLGYAALRRWYINASTASHEFRSFPRTASECVGADKIGTIAPPRGETSVVAE
jgi:hypothetical protein